MVDGARLLVYGWSFAVVGAAAGEVGLPWDLVAVATLSAFAGAFVGKRLLTKVTYTGLHWLVGILLLVVGVGMALGIV
jgi:uncharacterized membrane protein YfcA